jgi:predicted O-methyltransferase YrrM
MNSLKALLSHLIGASPKLERNPSQVTQELYYPPGHFYSPIVDREEANQHISEIEARPTPQMIQGIAIDRAEMVRTWHKLLPLIASSPFKERPSGCFRYAFENPYYSWGDGNVLQAMIRLCLPKRIMEIGSGWSSICMIETINHFLDGSCELTCIEAHPKRLRDLLGSEARQPNLTIWESRVQQVPVEAFDRLETGDILFIDSSHVLRTGSDVCHELVEILPRLSSGVIVHIHDIFWPFEYPRRWAVDENRSWNELYAVRLFLTQNDCWNVIMFNSFMAQMERKLIERTYPDFYKRPAAALWLQRR